MLDRVPNLYLGRVPNLYLCRVPNLFLYQAVYLVECKREQAKRHLLAMETSPSFESFEGKLEDGFGVHRDYLDPLCLGTSELLHIR